MDKDSDETVNAEDHEVSKRRSGFQAERPN
jgi:hypothetical protein